ncbi:MAG TPA: hypothetical protein VM913_02690 [Sphingomicrobium sp.]|nr:hypothetical protein [Sphingomicrobium sp.]
MAIDTAATGTTKKWGGRLPSRFFGAVAGIWLLTASSPSVAQERFVRISGLRDIDFGLIANFNVDAVRSQNLCAFSGRPNLGYNVRAFGTGPSGAFTLSNGVDRLPYEVQWAGTSGQNIGLNLTANVVRTGLISSAAQQTCSNGPATTATLIILIRAAALQSSAGGAYNGTLTLVVAPE